METLRAELDANMRDLQEIQVCYITQLSSIEVVNGNANVCCVE